MEHGTETSSITLYAYELKLSEFYYYYDTEQWLKMASLFCQVMQALDIFNRCSQGQER